MAAVYSCNPAPQNECRVITVSFDGFDDTGKTEDLGADKEAEKLVIAEIKSASGKKVLY